MPDKRIVLYRSAAFAAQGGLCYYCSLSMWHKYSEGFCVQHNLTPGDAKLLQCTAEHLRARKDGGEDTAENIAAACLRCNLGRHPRKKPMEVDRFWRWVSKRVQEGRWHSVRVLRALGLQARHQPTSRVRAGRPLPTGSRPVTESMQFSHGRQIELLQQPRITPLQCDISQDVAGGNH